MNDYEDFDYSNGADGSCKECGEDTAAPWHAYCGECYAKQQGWRRPDADALAFQHEDRERVTITRLVERMAALETRIARLERKRGAAT
jgi:hypothetical protein